MFMLLIDQRYGIATVEASVNMSAYNVIRPVFKRLLCSCWTGLSNFFLDADAWEGFLVNLMYRSRGFTTGFFKRMVLLLAISVVIMFALNGCSTCSCSLHNALLFFLVLNASPGRLERPYAKPGQRRRVEGPVP